MADSVFCQNCGELIKGEPPIADHPSQRPPCPKCSSTLRRIHHHLVANDITTLPASVGTPTLLSRSEDMLLTKAQELITTGDFSIAVVVVHMACEISAERAIS